MCVKPVKSMTYCALHHALCTASIALKKQHINTYSSTHHHKSSTNFCKACFLATCHMPHCSKMHTKHFQAFFCTTTWLESTKKNRQGLRFPNVPHCACATKGMSTICAYGRAKDSSTVQTHVALFFSHTPFFFPKSGNESLQLVSGVQYNVSESLQSRTNKSPSTQKEYMHRAHCC